ncbi:MAG: EAL domain-containing response regulator [Pseudomonadales bacterium]|nr:EAL domain-containing response regulator [Pseudomonadales bacterium]
MLNSALVVDDSTLFQNLIKAELTDLQVQTIRVCNDGREALALVEHNPDQFDCIITDLHMPKMDGLQFLEALGKAAYRGGVIIASSLEERIIQLAVNIALNQKLHLIGSLNKPIMPDKLAQLCYRTAQRQRLLQPDIVLIKKRILNDALLKNRVIPYFQPKIRFNEKKIAGLEVLARLDLINQHEIVAPNRFIPVAEKFGFIDQLTNCLFEKTLPQYKTLQTELQTPNLKLAFNLCATQLTDSTLPDRLCQYCDQYGVRQENIVLEVTERKIVSDTVQLMTLDRLRIHGFGLSLDDFGTGYTNVRQLREYPFTEIKVDKSLVNQIHDDRVSQIILRALIDLAHEYHMDIVVEGIEDIREYQYLEHFSDLVAQGFLISRPKSYEELIRWSHAWQNRPTAH